MSPVPQFSLQFQSSKASLIISLNFSVTRILIYFKISIFVSCVLYYILIFISFGIFFFFEVEKMLYHLFLQPTTFPSLLSPLLFHLSKYLSALLMLYIPLTIPSPLSLLSAFLYFSLSLFMHPTSLSHSYSLVAFPTLFLCHSSYLSFSPSVALSFVTANLCMFTDL